MASSGKQPHRRRGRKMFEISIETEIVIQTRINPKKASQVRDDYADGRNSGQRSIARVDSLFYGLDKTHWGALAIVGTIGVMSEAGLRS